MLDQITHAQAQVHRKTYSAILNRALSTPGSKKSLADRTGISPQHLSYILVTDGDLKTMRSEQRTPSPSLARKIAVNLPIAEHEQHQVLLHMLAAHRLSAGKASAILEHEQKPSTPPADRSPLSLSTIAILEQLHETVWRSPHPDEVDRTLNTITDLGTLTLNQVNPANDPLGFSATNLVLGQAFLLRGEITNALYHLLRAHSTFEFLDPRFYREQPTRADELEMRINLVLARLYSSSDQRNKAMEHLRRARSHRICTENPSAWIPSVAIEELRVLVSRHRFTLSQLNHLVEAAHTALGEESSPASLVWAQVQRQKVEGLLKYGKTELANAEFRNIKPIARDRDTAGFLDHIDFMTTFLKIQELDPEAKPRTKELACKLLESLENARIDYGYQPLCSFVKDSNIVSDKE